MSQAVTCDREGLVFRSVQAPYYRLLWYNVLYMLNERLTLFK